MHASLSSLCLRSMLGLFMSCAVLHAAGPPRDERIDLSGIWRFQTDPSDRGVAERWFSRTLTDGLRLPGSMAERGKGDDIRVNTAWTGLIVDSSWFTDPAMARFREPGKVLVPFWLTPRKHYVGAAWYQRTVSIPGGWRGRRIMLSLERAHWHTRVWVDTTFAGEGTSLGTPHTFDLTAVLGPGTHVVTVRVDNRLDPVDVGSSAHSVTDHTQTNWNGIVGAMTLAASPATGIADIAVVPDAAARSFRFRISVVRGNDASTPARVSVSAACRTGKRQHVVPVRAYPVTANSDTSVVEIDYPLGDGALLWDEFSPALYAVTVILHDTSGRELDRRIVRSGVREFVAKGTQFSVNGRPVMLRGTLESAIFPRTGYPPTDVESWRRIYRQCRAFGLNHIRFHSWCPPEAAFAAADEIGIYLHVEAGMWAAVGNGKPLDAWLYAESERIIRSYGHHPSFCMLAAGNEPAGKHQERYLGDLVEHLKSHFPGRLYTGSAGWSALPENQYHVYYGPRLQMWGAGLKSIINGQPPQTAADYRTDVARFTVPIISHEVGQWCVYPDLDEIRKYTGVLRAGNLEIVRTTLGDHHLGHLAHDLLMASGRLQTLCYKADIEALLRTPALGGFHLLDLHDFPGQGTAVVGVLNAFWEPKGYVGADEYRRFCNSTVPLARLPKLTFTDAESLHAAIDVSHYGPSAFRGARPRWRLVNSKGDLQRSGVLGPCDIPTGTLTTVGSISVPFGRTRMPQQLTLSVRVGEFENRWDVWVYPERVPAVDDRQIRVATFLTPPLLDSLEQGARVLLVAPPDTGNAPGTDPIEVGFSPIFWNTAWTQGQAPHTLGILCDPRHPALRSFPTGSSSDWQWWDAIHNARAIRLPQRDPAVVPIVRLIDDWNRNRPLALVAEFRVGRGRLFVSGIDLTGDRPLPPSLAWLRHSMLAYFSNSAAAPQVALSRSEVAALFPGCVR